MKIFLIFLVLACVLQSATAGIFSKPKPKPKPVKCKPNQKKVTLKVFVEHVQQSIASTKTLATEIKSSSSYDQSYSSVQSKLDMSGSMKGEASIAGGLLGSFSAEASLAFSNFNSEVKSSASSKSSYHYEQKMEEKKFQPGELQVLRTVTTTIMIGSTSATMTKREFVDSASTGLFGRYTRKDRKNASIDYLKTQFPGEESKIKETTYISEACVSSNGAASKKG